MVNENVVKNHFGKLSKTLEVKGLLDDAENIFSVDESGINTELRQKVIRKRAQKMYSSLKGSLDQITIHYCINATGHALPPMLYHL